MTGESVLGKPPVRRNKPTKLLVLVVASLLVLILLFGIAKTLTKESPYKNAFKSVQKDAKFPILYPKKISPDFQLQTDSIQLSSNLVSSSYKAGDKTIVVIQQSKPEDFKSSILTGSKDIKTSSGKGYITELGNKPRGIIVTNQTLVSISGSNEIDEATLTKFIENF